MSLILLGLVMALGLSLFLLCSWIVFVDIVAFAFWSFEVLLCILRHTCDSVLFLFSVFSLKFVFVYPNQQ